ncbi:Zinc/iron permease [Scheffersomyces coipomensis]|uniref:Zinc/iron permease n=1 Tax=Scheffersomyces coipomensis TaxID=1788519 RepID=UPI00315C5B83
MLDTTVEILKRGTCPGGNDYNGSMGARISSVFVIFATSSFGAFFPILSSRYSFIRLPSWCFFIAKYFGSGVIVATAFIHLLQPANQALSEECLGPAFQEYPYSFAICLFSLFALFFFELVAYRLIDKRLEGSGQSHSHFGDESVFVKKAAESDSEDAAIKHEKEDEDDEDGKVSNSKEFQKLYPEHFSHAHDHQDPEALGTPVEDQDKEQYYGQLLNVFVLEFGIIFHSVFVGLTLAVAGDEFATLYVVLVFHQMFEGLGLGTRIATTYWPKDKKWTPWLLAAAYGLTTPISIAIGLGVRESYPPNSTTATITNGVFDSISAGILIYTGIVELMAHEFLFSNEFKGKTGFRKMLWAYFIMCWGTGLMALLGKWA